MSARNPLTVRRLPEATRRRLEVAGAMAWESLVDAHTSNALQFLALLAGRVAFEDAVSRYLKEMSVGEPVAQAVRNRVLVALEGVDLGAAEARALELLDGSSGDAAPKSSVWRRLRPDRLLRAAREHRRRTDETDRWIMLAIALAEENVIRTHIENAVTFAALLDEHMPLHSAVREYVVALGITGARAQAVYQRAMARLAEVHLLATGRMPPAQAAPEALAAASGKVRKTRRPLG